MTTKKTSGRSHGFKHKSRSIMTKNAPRGVSFLLRKYHEGDKAVVIIDPRQHKGLPHRRYHGKVGTINKVGRRSVILDIKLGNKMKTLITDLIISNPLVLINGRSSKETNAVNTRS